MRTPTSRKEPDCVFPVGAGNEGSVISTLELVVLSTAPVIDANTPVAPSILIGSVGGIAPPIPVPVEMNPTGDEVIGEGYVILKTVVVSGEFAIKAPDTRI